jgi:hypothetical protein
MTDTLELSRIVAPEDLRIGDCIAILSAAEEIVSYGCDCSQAMLPVRIVWMCGSGDPLRVEAICLPFVLVVSPSGEHSTLDIRRSRLVRLSARYASAAFKRLAANKNADDADANDEGE